MSVYQSAFAEYIEQFIHFRKASGVWNKMDEQHLRIFDHYCADRYGSDAALTEEMVHAWCQQRKTETRSSCYKRIIVIKDFIDYLRSRGMSEVDTPNMPKYEQSNYVPHAFTNEELVAFFNACDNIVPWHNRRINIIRQKQCPAFFRLLYSSGIRTTEARYLRRTDVDLNHGVLNIQKSKGYDQHYVALHDSMTELLREYDAVMDGIQPDRTYFFESAQTGRFLSADWVCYNFRTLWAAAGNKSDANPYDLRHNYATVNIMSWDDNIADMSQKLYYLSKSMGHSHLKSTIYYFSIVPLLAKKLEEKTEAGFNDIVPEVPDEEIW